MFIFGRSKTSFKIDEKVHMCPHSQYFAHNFRVCKPTKTHSRTSEGSMYLSSRTVPHGPIRC